MDDQELDRRLSTGDPARATPLSLDAVVDDLIRRPVSRTRRRRWRVAAVAGGAVLMAGSLAAFTDIETYVMSTPPFSALDEGTARTTDGIDYVPVGRVDHGEQCRIWVDFGGLTEEQFSDVNSYWSDADPTAFANGVDERLEGIPLEVEKGPIADGEAYSDPEVYAVRDQLLEDFSRLVPGMAWGTAPYGESFNEGEPHLTTFSTVCDDDLEALRG